MPVILPQTCGTGSVVRVPTQPLTVGDHIRRKRLGLKRLQGEVAEQIGVCEPSVFSWEANASQPDLKYMLVVVRFLGYKPLPAADTLGERLVRHPTLGLSQKEAAKHLGVGPGTLARWEREEREPAGSSPGHVERFLCDEEAADLEARRVG